VRELIKQAGAAGPFVNAWSVKSDVVTGMLANDTQNGNVYGVPWFGGVRVRAAGHDLAAAQLRGGRAARDGGGRRHRRRGAGADLLPLVAPGLVAGAVKG
jgi:hypothetical protein